MALSVENKSFVILESVETGTRFFTSNKPGVDLTRSSSGVLWYKILGYADSVKEAHNLICETPYSRAKNLYEKAEPPAPPKPWVEPTCSKYVRKGVFFRSPLFKRYYDAYEYPSPARENVYETRDRSTILGFVHWILNSSRKIKDLIEFLEKNERAAGYTLRSIRSPVYFAREERTSMSVVNGLLIKSVGYNYLDDPVSGYCVEEKTTVYRITGDYKEEIFSKYTHNVSNGNNSYNITYDFKLTEVLREAFTVDSLEARFKSELTS